MEGDSTQQQGARKIRRRALGFSVVLQTLFVAGLILFPLLSRGERIELKNVTPIPPYPSFGHSARNPKPNDHPAQRHFRPTIYFSPKPLTHDVNRANDDPAPPDFPTGTEDGRDHGTPFSSPTSGPERPDKNAVQHRVEEKTRRISVSQFTPAMLTYRVEPIYPALPLHMHHDGRVELRAVISTDGSIQSLEVVSGDPLFYQSALAAVREWRYQPTSLNGRPVEVDTHITVVYTLPR